MRRRNLNVESFQVLMDAMLLNKRSCVLTKPL